MATAKVELKPEERQFLELVYQRFERDLAWPEPSPIKRQLYQRGIKVDFDALLASLSPDLVREAELSGTRLRLTLAGLRAIHRMTELNDFICFLRTAMEKYAALTPDKTLSTADVAKCCGLDSPRLRKLAVLLEAEPFIAHATRSAPDGGPFEWEVHDEVTRYEAVFDIDAYLVARRRELEKLAQAAIPPVHLLAAEGIRFSLGPTGPIPTTAIAEADVPGADALPTGLHPLIEEQVRTPFLGGKYDLGVFAALKAVEVRVRRLGGFGNDLVGVELMNRAFGPGGPLADQSLPRSEQEGMRSLFAGAYAVLRNPAGHREVDYGDVLEAADGAHTASLLMRVLDRVEKRLE